MRGALLVALVVLGWSQVASAQVPRGWNVEIFSNGSLAAANGQTIFVPNQAPAPTAQSAKVWGGASAGGGSVRVFIIAGIPGFPATGNRAFAPGGVSGSGVSVYMGDVGGPSFGATGFAKPATAMTPFSCAASAGPGTGSSLGGFNLQTGFGARVTPVP